MRLPIPCVSCGGTGADPNVSATALPCPDWDGEGWRLPVVRYNEEQSRYLLRRLAGLPLEEEMAARDMAWEGCPHDPEGS